MRTRHGRLSCRKKGTPRTIGPNRTNRTSLESDSLSPSMNSLRSRLEVMREHSNSNSNSNSNNNNNNNGKKKEC